jgi:hypothetical protein
MINSLRIDVEIDYDVEFPQEIVMSSNNFA